LSMRNNLVIAAGGGVLAIAALGFVAVRAFDGGAMKTASVKEASDVTGAVGERWPGPPADKTQAPAPAPKIDPAAAKPAETKPAETKAAPAPVQTTACANPNALGVSRTLQIDTTGGPGLGLSQYRDYDFLQPGEVVLTFDDGPWPVTTPAVLAALDTQCTKATFFPVGKHATWHPDVLKQVFAHGHTVGSHTWGHVNLAKRPLQDAKDEIEKGISAVSMSAGQPIAPFFRFPQLRQTSELKAYLGERNIAAFSIDVDSEDFRIKKPELLVSGVMAKLQKTGKGIVLMHDLHKWTATALPELLAQLKAGGYKIVHLKAKDTLTTMPQYDAMVAPMEKVNKPSNGRPIASVISTIAN
jgi:peptidoglycan/xylan/chitin deacetylase (PgdA/CDA1 family)